jgi:thymidylate synthase ThyX
MTTQISARIIADSLSPAGKRLTTFVLEYPRFIHAEFMTHRLFSRNASSSRAIPVEKQIRRVIDDPAMPVYWGKNQAGMQAAEELSDRCSVHPAPVGQPGGGPFFLRVSPRDQVKEVWLEARDNAVASVMNLQRLGLHKQLASRPLEPWMWITVVCTATEFGNWYNLRYHKMAQPEIQVLAQRMYEAHEDSIPTIMRPGDWHLPFVTNKDWLQLEDFITKHPEHNAYLLQKISAARCARVSYNNHDGSAPDLLSDCELYERLMSGFPKHASPTEHQACVPYDHQDPVTSDYDWLSDLKDDLKPHLRSNLQGWVQFRKLIPGEYMPTFPGPTP